MAGWLAEDARRLGFHPLKSGRNGRRLLRKKRIEEVSIPSSRVGTLLHCSTYSSTTWFPSPQVGSEPFYIVPLIVAQLGFHPLKSGRNFVLLLRVLQLLEVSIPSSRVGTYHLYQHCLILLQVSIPSSRVGTSFFIYQVRPYMSFHPLKSGRNKFASRHPRTVYRVSIPSSRVGTGLRRCYNLRKSMFPSPQVGSELLGGG